MANYTDYIDGSTGLTLYAKARPLDTGTWANGVVAYSENGTSGEYSATLDGATKYKVYSQAGGSPASSDTWYGDVKQNLAGATYDDDTDSLEAISNSMMASVTVTPVQGVVSSPVTETNIEIFIDETKTIAIAVTDADGDAVDVSGMTLEVAIEDASGTDVATVADGSITKVTSTASFDVPAAASANVGEYRWAMRRSTGNAVLMHGRWTVLKAPDVD